MKSGTAVVYNGPVILSRWAPIAILLIAAACARAGSTTEKPSIDPGLKKLAQDALALARQGKNTQALAALNRVLDAQPGLSKVRLLRAKVYLRLDQWDKAVRDAQRVLKELPGNAAAAQILAKAGAQARTASPTSAASPSGYSAWKRSWTQAGTTPIQIADLQGGAGYTLFYFPQDPSSKAETETMEKEATQDQLYFLRVVDLRSKNGKVDLGLPAAKTMKVASVPDAILVDSAGSEVARGDAVRPVLDKLRKLGRNKREADARKLTTADYASSNEALEDLAATGYTTVVMLGSTGCEDCRKILPRIEGLPGHRDKTRVVFANIGVVGGKINFAAPVVRRYQIRGTPTFFILDDSGHVVSRDDDARRTVMSWLGP